jgi:hypothetical protein
MRNCKGIKVLAIIKELNGIDSGFILINLKIKHPVRTLTWLELDDLTDSIVACMPNASDKLISKL